MQLVVVQTRDVVVMRVMVTATVIRLAWILKIVVMISKMNAKKKLYNLSHYSFFMLPINLFI